MTMRQIAPAGVNAEFHPVSGGPSSAATAAHHDLNSQLVIAIEKLSEVKIRNERIAAQATMLSKWMDPELDFTACMGCESLEIMANDAEPIIELQFILQRAAELARLEIPAPGTHS